MEKNTAARQIYIVTGITGHLGNVIARYLLKNGEQICFTENDNASGDSVGKNTV